MVDSPEKGPRVPNRTLRRKAEARPTVEAKKVPSEARHAHTLQRKAAVKPAIEERKKRQKKSQQHLKRSTIKQTSGHLSPRPNRHVDKRKKLEKSTNA